MHSTCLRPVYERLFFFFLTSEGLSLPSAAPLDLGPCTPTFPCTGSPDCPVPLQGHSSEGSDSQAPSSRVLARSRLTGAQGGAFCENWWAALGYLERGQLPNPHCCSIHLNILGSSKPNRLTCNQAQGVSQTPGADTDQPNDSEPENSERKQGWARGQDS